MPVPDGLPLPRPAKPPALTGANTLAASPPRLFAGTSGWAYPSWKPGFYPEGLPAKKFLPFYASQMNSVEVNYTFRKLPSVQALADWIAATPEGFRFSFKAPQRITHFKRLRECETDLTQFFEVLKPVRDAGKLGLLLFQLPPNFKADAERLRSFLDEQAFKQDGTSPLAFEFRHESWFSPKVEVVLSDHDAALCIAESDDLATPEMHPAATHTSFRLRRNGGYKKAELAAFAKRFLQLSKARDVYIYFKHEDEPTGARNGVSLLKRAVAEARKLA